MTIKLQDGHLLELLPDIIMRDEELRRAVDRAHRAQAITVRSLMRRAAATILRPFHRPAAPASPQLG